MGTGFSPEVKGPGRGVDYLPALSAEVKERVELYLYCTSGPSWHITGWTFISSPWQQWLHESASISRYAHIARLPVDNKTLALLGVLVI